MLRVPLWIRLLLSWFSWFQGLWAFCWCLCFWGTWFRRRWWRRGGHLWIDKAVHWGLTLIIFCQDCVCPSSLIREILPIIKILDDMGLDEYLYIKIVCLFYHQMIIIIQAHITNNIVALYSPYLSFQHLFLYSLSLHHCRHSF